MSITDLEQAVLKEISRKAGIPISRLSMRDRLLQDLGIDGDDAAELFMHFARVHGVDMSGLELSRHFRPEPNLLSILRSPSAKRSELAEKVPITVGDLVRAIRTGKWEDTDQELG
jgi:hypothetical protein